MQTEISEDIFFVVKKQILDKLDIILQKVNLKILGHMEAPIQNFEYIQLSHFEEEISTLFQYLDKLYNSLNSSVSMSSYNSLTQLKGENSRLVEQNCRLKEIIRVNSSKLTHKIQCPSIISSNKNSISHSKDFQHCFSHEDVVESRKQQKIKKMLMKSFLPELRNDCMQILEMMKQIRSEFKSYKFLLLETKVNIITKIKEFGMQKQQQKTSIENQQFFCQSNVLARINQILSKC